MPLEEIAEGAIKIVGRVLIELFVEVFLRIICFYVGYYSLWILSFGQYPRGPVSTRDETLCSFVGFVVIVGIPIGIWIGFAQ